MVLLVCLLLKVKGYFGTLIEGFGVQKESWDFFPSCTPVPVFVAKRPGITRWAFCFIFGNLIFATGRAGSFEIAGIL